MSGKISKFKYEDLDETHDIALEEQNPFSFKKFINNPIIQSPDLNLPELAVKNNKQKTNQIPEQLADSKMPSIKTNPFSFKNFIASEPPPPNTLTCDVPSMSPPDSIFLPSPPDFLLKTANNLTNDCAALPDFINESTLNSHMKNNDLPRKNSISKVAHMPSYFDLETTLSEDDRKTQIINEQSERISQLENKINKLKLKEANENRALESMIQQVEENLVKTTKRAVESERSAEKMKLEIKQLKSQLSFLQSENALLKNNSSLKEGDQSKKLQDFADQINNASTSAESLLRQLLSGCDTLKLIASSLESYEKIKEINENSS